jgi:hypothetical protein
MKEGLDCVDVTLLLLLLLLLQLWKSCYWMKLSFLLLHLHYF